MNPNPVYSPARVAVRRRTDLSQTNLGWVQLTDHFIATVGAASGTGAPLGDLLVLADATLAPGRGFQLHSHQNVEVATLVLEGAIVHREPGRELAVPAGSAQWMSAGTGIVHAETNPGAEPARLLQIWLRPRHPGGAPEHAIRELPELGPRLERVSPRSLRVDATLSMARLAPGETTEVNVSEGRVAYLFFAGGPATVDEQDVADGDGALVHAGCSQVQSERAVTLVVIDVALPKTPLSFPNQP